jgi:hypothetical protein
MTAQPQGFDISHYQAALTPEKVAELFVKPGGYTFAGIKMSEGSYQTDPNFAANRAALRSHGVPRWLYHEVTTQAASVQFERIMSSCHGELYPRERLTLALGDFGASAMICSDLVNLCATKGPTKKVRTPGLPTRWRPTPVLYANNSNFEGVYRMLPGPRVAAAYPGPPSVACVIHQDADHDPATGGDHDVWTQDPSALMHFFRS